jgi:energy-coupling factor transporter transmembrane protein EcfT
MKINNLTERVLLSLADALNPMLSEPTTPIKVSPWALILSLFSLAVAVSFSRGSTAPLLGLLILLVSMFFFRVRFVRVLKIMSWVLVFTLLVVAPMAIYKVFLYGQESGISSLLFDRTAGMVPLILRATVASAFIAMSVMALGLKDFIKGLRELGLHPIWAESVVLTIRFIPVMIRTLVKLLFAREARLIVRKWSIRNLWHMVSTVAGEVIVRGYERSQRVQLALKARGVEEIYNAPLKRRIYINDAIFLAISLTFVAIILFISGEAWL